jgi:hypothetical protein
MSKIRRIGDILNGSEVEREGPFCAHWREIAAYCMPLSVGPPALGRLNLQPGGVNFVPAGLIAEPRRVLPSEETD